MNESTSPYRGSKLQGAENFHNWQLGIMSFLMFSGGIHIWTTKEPSDEKDTSKMQHAWSLIIQSLSEPVMNSLSEEVEDFNNPSAFKLFTELKMSYSAVSGANKAHLIAQLIGASISEGEDPIPPWSD